MTNDHFIPTTQKLTSHKKRLSPLLTLPVVYEIAPYYGPSAQSRSGLPHATTAAHRIQFRPGPFRVTVPHTLPASITCTVRNVFGHRPSSSATALSGSWLPFRPQPTSNTPADSSWSPVRQSPSSPTSVAFQVTSRHCRYLAAK